MKPRSVALASLLLLSACICAAADVPTVSESPTQAPPAAWDDWVKAKVASSETAQPVIQDREIEKAGRVQIAGPFGGVGSRGDLYDNYFVSAGARYYFNETQGWELLHVDFGLFSRSPLAEEIYQKTSFYPDSQPSRFQLSTGYIYSPVYGKYAWGAEHLIHFDVYGIVGPGLRFTTTGNIEPYLFAGIGSNQFVLNNHLSVIPEFRLRTYSEQRTGSTLVWESIFQLGVAWLL